VGAALDFCHRYLRFRLIGSACIHAWEVEATVLLYSTLFMFSFYCYTNILCTFPLSQQVFLIQRQSDICGVYSYKC
jgi:hypothetical protein